ncbi:unnamed protein product [Withania somnifera]
MRKSNVIKKLGAWRGTQKIQHEIDILPQFPNEKVFGKQAIFLADILNLVESVHNSLVQNIEPGAVLRSLSRQTEHVNAPAEYVLTEEIRKYLRIKPNSIGHACFSMNSELDEYMNYDVGEMCNDDWRLAEKLMVDGCDPLPRRRCFARAPQLWSQYRCKNYTCLARNSTVKGFFKCTDCFNRTHHESPRWIVHSYQDSNSKMTAEILITEVLNLKPGEIRISLDFSVGTGTFAARMKEHNVTIVSATYILVLPFFNNTLDFIHTTRFLDGWMDFVLYDFDRVLRPGGLLWIDSFFCLKEELNDYLEAFKIVRYKHHKRHVVPKLDKDDTQVFV